MVGRNSGLVREGGQIIAKFSADASLVAGGDVKIAKQLMNCHICIGGALVAGGASVIGGSLYVKGRIEVAHLGSEANPLGLTTGEGGGGPFEGEILETYGFHEAQAFAYFRQYIADNGGAAAIEIEVFENIEKGAGGRTEEVGQGERLPVGNGKANFPA